MSGERSELAGESLREQRERIRDDALRRIEERFGRPPEYALEWARESIRREREGGAAA